MAELDLNLKQCFLIDKSDRRNNAVFFVGIKNLGLSSQKEKSVEMIYICIYTHTHKHSRACKQFNVHFSSGA